MQKLKKITGFPFLKHQESVLTNFPPAWFEFVKSPILALVFEKLHIYY